MTATEVILVEHLEQMDRVVQEMLKGSQPRQIAKTLGIKIVEVEAYIQEWQGYARNNKYVQDRAKDALMATDQHYDIIVKELWQAVDEADTAGDIRIKTGTLKMIADIEQKRIEMLQKSGLLENQQLADQVVETERRQEALVKILRRITNEHPEVASWLRTELSRVTGVAEGTVVKVES